MPEQTDIRKLKMIPTLKLGPLDSPRLEIMPEEINPIVALLIEECPSTDCDVLNSVWSFLLLDCLHLSQSTEEFFISVENVCKRIVVGELTTFSADRIKASEFEGFLRKGVDEGVVTEATKIAAQRFLDFLAAHPEKWPFRDQLQNDSDPE